MSGSSMDKVRNLIELNSDIAEFGTAEDAVGNTWLDKAEQTLGVTLPESYKWFLNNYVGGEIGGEEVFSVYGMEFDDINGGDIVYQHLNNQKNGLTEPLKIVVTETDFGEIFFFDYSQFDDKECPIYMRLPSGSAEPYAKDFYEFLQKRIEIHLA